jgi:tRNA(Ile)-lysidine synthase
MTPCIDASKTSLSLLRNRVRHELLPLLQKYNPGIFESLLRLGSIAEDDLAFLEAEAAWVRPQVMKKKDNTIIFDKDRFKNLAPALQRHLLRLAVEELTGTLKDIETRHIEEVLEALAKPAGRRIILPEGLVFSIEYDRYLLGRHPKEQVPFPELNSEYEIKIPGLTEIPGWTIETSLYPRESFRPEEDSFTACFDKEKIGDKIKVRSRQKGDSFQPLGMERTKKVGQFMLDARIPQAWRSRIPILCTPQQVVWIAGWRLDERVKVIDDTRTILCVKMRCVKPLHQQIAPGENSLHLNGN